MKKAILIVACAAMTLIVSSPCYADEPYVQITSAYTTDDSFVDCTEFGLWDPIVCHIEYTVSGTADKYYKVVGMTQVFGDKVAFVDRVPPGNYAVATIHHVTGDAQPGTEICQYKIKLKKRTNGTLMVLDTDSAISEITIVE
jgi:hypothetical protein